MGVDKVILRAFLSTLAAIGILLSFMILSLVAFFPSTMMECAYDLGMESSSIRFAERAYKSSDDVYYIAYATEVAIEDDRKGKILSCGEKFLKDKHFEDYCAEKNESYRQYIFGQVSVCKYEKGDKSSAVELACSAIKEGTFPKNNAVVAVIVASLQENDAATLDEIYAKISGLKVGEGDSKNLSEALEIIQQGK